MKPAPSGHRWPRGRFATALVGFTIVGALSPFGGELPSFGGRGRRARKRCRRRPDSARPARAIASDVGNREPRTLSSLETSPHGWSTPRHSRVTGKGYLCPTSLLSRPGTLRQGASAACSTPRDASGPWKIAAGLLASRRTARPVRPSESDPDDPESGLEGRILGRPLLC